MAKKKTPIPLRSDDFPSAEGKQPGVRRKVVWLVGSIVAFVAALALFVRNADEIAQIVRKYTTNQMSISISDVNTVVSVDEVEGPPPEKKPVPYVVNSVDFILKNERGSSATECTYDFREHIDLIKPFVKTARPFKLASGQATVRKAFHVTFFGGFAYPHKKIRFRIVCDGVVSNLLSAEVFDHTDWARNITRPIKPN